MLWSALACASGNIVSRAVGRVDALGYMVWRSVFAVLRVMRMSVAMEHRAGDPDRFVAARAKWAPV